ncbi:hypothetical protein G6726_01745 [Polynucleobacter paneuropaeus]|nr:hypothetical protein G6726_01745 [Polynucleobacter paneuropaeus]
MKASQIVANHFTHQLEKFRNRHDGEACYIFGDGPSIKWFDLNEFRDYPSICCGMIPFHKDFKKLDVRYVAMVEPWLFAPKLLQPKILHSLRGVAAEYKRHIATFPEKEVFVNLSNRFNISGGNINYLYRYLPSPKTSIERQINALNCFSGSFHATLTLAFYMGFKKIYLVGFDGWVIQPSRALRWYELGEGYFFQTDNYAIDFLNVLKNEVDIFTISHEGESCNVENINYETYVGKPPVYKENNLLMDERHLRAMSTCWEYKVYK